MPYVQRDTNGKVTGRYARQQPGYAEEWLADGHVDLMPSTDELAGQAAKEQAKIALEQLRVSTKATTLFTVLENATLLQINTWVDNNFPDMTANQKAVMKVLMAVAGMYLREK